MKKKIVLSILLLLLIGVNHSYACMCFWRGGLLKMAQTDSLTIQAKVNKYLSYSTDKVMNRTFPTSMEVEVVRILKGKEERKLITVWGDEGWACRPYLTAFSIGSEWVLSLKRWEDGEYEISICGEHYVPIHGGMAVGYLIHNSQDA